MVGDPGRRRMPRYARDDAVAWRRLGNEIVVVGLASKRMMSLNSAGAAVWEQLAAAVTLAELARSTGMPADDISVLLRRLQEEGVVTATDDDTPPAADGGPGGSSPGPSAPDAPRVLWSEPLESAVGLCLKQPGNPGCFTGPFNTS